MRWVTLAEEHLLLLKRVRTCSDQTTKTAIVDIVITTHTFTTET